jgi:hypothetical protein
MGKKDDWLRDHFDLEVIIYVLSGGFFFKRIYFWTTDISAKKKKKGIHGPILLQLINYSISSWSELYLSYFSFIYNSHTCLYRLKTIYINPKNQKNCPNVNFSQKKQKKKQIFLSNSPMIFPLTSNITKLLRLTNLYYNIIKNEWGHYWR